MDKRGGRGFCVAAAHARYFYGNLQPISGGAMPELQNFSDSSSALTDSATRTLPSNRAIPDQRGDFFDGWPGFSSWLAFSSNEYLATAAGTRTWYYSCTGTLHSCTGTLYSCTAVLLYCTCMKNRV